MLYIFSFSNSSCVGEVSAFGGNAVFVSKILANQWINMYVICV